MGEKLETINYDRLFTKDAAYSIESVMAKYNALGGNEFKRYYDLSNASDLEEYLMDDEATILEAQFEGIKEVV